MSPQWGQVNSVERLCKDCDEAREALHKAELGPEREAAYLRLDRAIRRLTDVVLRGKRPED